MKTQEGKGLILILIIVLLVVLGLWWLMKQGYIPKQTAGPAIQNASDLDVAAKDLDGTDLNQIDAGSDQLNSDSSAF